MLKRRAGWTGMAVTLLLLATSVAAQGPQRPGPGRGANGDGPRRMMPVEQRDAGPRDGDLRERGPRLSPEERRQLRRDVHDAGRDLYPGRMSPRRREAGRE